MAVSELRPQTVVRSRRGDYLIWGVIIVLGLLFAGLTAYRIRARDLDEASADKLRELSAAAAKTPAAAQTGMDWPQWRGPNRDGVSTETGLLESWPEQGLNVLWSQPSGDGYSSVVVANGRVVTMVQDGKDEAVVSWDAATGKELWRYKYPAHFRHRQFGDGPRSTPAIADDHVYTVGGTGIMHCLKLTTDRTNGEMVWRKDLRAEFGAPQLDWGISFSPLVEKERVYIMPGGPNGKSLAALDCKTGAVVWQNLDDDASYSSPVAADLVGRRQIVFLTAERLLSVAPDSGMLLWEFPWPAGPAHTPSSITTPLVIHRDIGDYVFVSSGYDKGSALIKIEADGTGFRASQVYKNLNLRTVFSSCVCRDDFIYGFDDVNLVCLDLRSGKKKWKEYGFGRGSLALADGHLIILSDQGTLALAAADPQEYREVSRFQHSDQRSTWTVPVIADGRLYVRDWTRVVCYELKKKAVSAARKERHYL